MLNLKIKGYGNEDEVVREVVLLVVLWFLDVPSKQNMDRLSV